MKPDSSPPVSVPRLNSLLQRLQKIPAPKDDDPYLDQLMVFLDDPPPGTTDRWKAGAEMCAAWGCKTSGTSVWRLYRSHVLEWRVRVALKIDNLEGETTETLNQKSAHLLALRTCEMLANPALPLADFISLRRLDLRQKYYEIARQKHVTAERDQTELAIEALKRQASCDRLAELRLVQLEEALRERQTPAYQEMLRTLKIANLMRDPGLKPKPQPQPVAKPPPKSESGPDPKPKA